MNLARRRFSGRPIVPGVMAVLALSWPGSAPAKQRLAPRETRVEDPCAEMDGAKLKAILRYGPVEGSHYQSWNPLDVEKGKQWDKEQGDRFRYTRVIISGERRFSLGVPVTENDPVSFLVRGPKLHYANDIRLEMQAICDAKSRGLHPQWLTFVDLNDAARISRRLERQGLAAQENARRMEARRMREALRQPPSRDELEIILRKGWPRYAGFFRLAETQLGRVRSALCEREKTTFICHIGVTATSRRGPEYEEADVELARDSKGGWMVVEPAEPDIVIT